LTFNQERKMHPFVKKLCMSYAKQNNAAQQYKDPVSRVFDIEYIPMYGVYYRWETECGVVGQGSLPASLVGDLITVGAIKD
jgi:hypothetical protein